MNKRLKLSIFITAILLLLTACGRNRNDENEPEEAVLAGTLTILAPETHAPILYSAEDTLRTSLGLVGDRADELQIEFELFPFREHRARKTRLHVEIMAGDFPDIFFMPYRPQSGSRMDSNNTWRLLNSGVLACFYQLIDRDPYSNIEDLFYNALTRWEVNGRLHTFPMALGLELVSINSTLPPSIVSRFTAKESISIHELVRLILDLRTNYPELAHMQSLGFDLNIPSGLLRPVLNGFVDFDNSVSYLNDSRFVDFLYDWHRLFAGRDLYRFEFVEIPGVRHRARYHSSVASHVAFFTGEREHALFPQFNPYFIHSIPLTDEQGRLVTEEQRHSYILETGRPLFFGSWELPMINARANGPLAWEFVKHIADAFVNSRYTIYHINTSVVRSQVERQMTDSFLLLFRLLGGVNGTVLTDDDGEILGILYRDFFEDFQEQQQVIGDIVSRVHTLAEMPFATPSFVPFSLYEEVLNSFLSMPGSITAATAAAQEVHNRVSLWLVE